MTKWGKTAVKQSGMAGCWIGANRKRMCAQAGSSSLPPPQSQSQQARVSTTKSHIRQWLHTSDDLTAATVHPVGTLFFFTRGDLAVTSTSAQQVKLTVQITSQKKRNTEIMTYTFRTVPTSAVTLRLQRTTRSYHLWRVVVWVIFFRSTELSCEIMGEQKKYLQCCKEFHNTPACWY